MTLLPKKALYKIFLFTILISFLIIAVIAIFASGFSLAKFIILSILFTGLLLIFRRNYFNTRRKFRSEFENIQEKINLLIQSIGEKRKILKVLPSRSERVFFLFNISQKLIELNDSEEIYDFLVDACANLFPQSDDALLFIIQKNKSMHNLVRSFKKEGFVIKEKEGDVIEKWVLRNNQSILVENLTKDFRFDYNKIVAFTDRKVLSFIASPLSINERIVGTIRVESKKDSAFSLEDSRLLRSVCDIGVMVLEKANLFKSIEELVIKDPLTSLFLRDYFFMRLKEELQRVKVTGKKLGLIMLDIDNFKQVNDTYGHIVGDLVLKKLSKILTSIIGDSGNVVSRFGGEEFIFFAVESTRDEMIAIGEKIRKTVEETIISFRRKKVSFTVSMGLVMYPDSAVDILSLIDEADRLLYKAKAEGKNKLCYK